MAAIARTTMIIVSLAITIYIAVITTGDYLAKQRLKWSKHPLFQILVGRAPDLVPTILGYIGQISEPPQMCVYHGQFGFGKPVTDVALKNISDRSVNLTGPHSVAIPTHESFIPSTPSFEEIQHQAQQVSSNN